VRAYHRYWRGRRFRKVAVLLLLPAAFMVTTVAVSRAAVVPPQNPPSDLPASPALYNACAFNSQINDTCTTAGVAEIDADRAQEGLGPLTLPTNFSSLDPAEQMFVITNLERVDRGLPPVAGLSAELDGYAQQGADSGVDPSFPPGINGGGSLWAGTPNIFDAYQAWMYDDGWDGSGSSNESCTSPSAPLCWGHRDILLGSDASPLLMGAAVSTNGQSGSVAVVLAGGDGGDAPYFTWAQVTQNLPVGLSSAVPSGLSEQGQTTSAVRAWASGEPMNITASVSGGEGQISVAPSACNLSAGQTCNLAVTFASANVASLNAVLMVTGPNGPQFVPLVGNPGYREAASDGGVFAFGAAGFHGSAGSLALSRPIVGMASTPDGNGYWEVASDGGVFSFGNAGFYGSAGNLHLRRPIVGMAATPDGMGYWLVASDGGIFSYGDARFYGSAGGLPLRRSIVGMASTPDGKGYWLVASDGGVFTYGDARFYGSAGSLYLRRSIVGMAATPDGNGYWLVASDGGVFSYGAAGFYGSAGATALRRPIVGIASTPEGNGYWLVASDGGVFTYGSAQYYGSGTSLALRRPIVGLSPS
jgi:hypothetical protein